MFAGVSRPETISFTDFEGVNVVKLTITRVNVVIDPDQLYKSNKISYTTVPVFLKMNIGPSPDVSQAERILLNLMKRGALAALTQTANEFGVMASTLEFSPLIAEKVSQGPFQLFNTADPHKPLIMALGKIMSQETWKQVQAEALAIAQAVDAERAEKVTVEPAQKAAQSTQTTPMAKTAQPKVKENSAQDTSMSLNSNFGKESAGPHANVRAEIAAHQNAHQKKLHEKQRLEASLARLDRFKAKDLALYELNHAIAQAARA